MFKGLFLFLVLALFFTACDKNVKPTINSSTISPTSTINKVENVSFEISSFGVSYKNDSGDSYFSESYTGSGIINVVGDASLVKKPYEVLIDIKKISGGSRDSFSEGKRSITVNNGIGTFGTSDWNRDKSLKMDKPIYEINVVGYIPYIEVAQKK